MEEDITYGMQTLYSCAYMLEYKYFLSTSNNIRFLFGPSNLERGI